MRVYIANLGKYNEGKYQGAWFKLPINEQEMRERIGLTGRYEEYVIHDYELPFKLDYAYMSIDELNNLCKMIMELEGTGIYMELKAIQECWFSSLEELLECKDNIVHYPDCQSMRDVAFEFMEKCEELDSVSERYRKYFDYEKLGQDMSFKENFLVTSHGVFKYCN